MIPIYSTTVLLLYDYGYIEHTASKESFQHAPQVLSIRNFFSLYLYSPILNPLHGIGEQYEKHLYNQSSHYNKYGRFHHPKHTLQPQLLIRCESMTSVPQIVTSTVVEKQGRAKLKPWCEYFS